MRNKLGGFCLLTALVISSSFAVPTKAATTQPVKRAPMPRYDASKEVTLKGTVSIVKASVSGSVMGGHLLLSSGNKTVDAHLGPFALRGAAGVKVSPGEQVKLVGVMTTLHGNQIFLVRTIETANTTYTIRNEHGAPLLMGAKEPDHRLSLAKGGAR
jgi:hypothetical protein